MRVRTGHPLFLVALFAGAVLVGIAPGALPMQATVMIIGVALCALAAVLLRRALVTATSHRGEDLGVRDTPVLSDARTWRSHEPELRFPRVLFYLGTLTVAESSFRPAFGLTLSEMFFILAFAGAFFAALRGRALAPVPASLVVGVGVFAIGGAISSVGASSPTDSGTEVLHGVYVMLLWAWTGSMVLRTREQIVTALTLWGVSVAASSVGALAQVFGVEGLAGPLAGGRATGFTFHPNDLGGAAGIALVPALMLATRAMPSRSPWRTPFYWLIVGLISAGLVLSASVAGMAAGFVAILVWLSSPSVRAPGRVAVVAALSATLVVVSLAGGKVTSPAERLEQVTSGAGTQIGAGSGEERISIVETSWPRIRENPFVGTGLDPTGTAVSILSNGQTIPYQAHGAPIAAWYMAGILGLAGIVTVFCGLGVAGWRAATTAGANDDLLIGWALFAAFAGFVVYSMTGPLVFQQYGWFSAVMVVAWWARSEAHAPARVGEPAQWPHARVGLASARPLSG